MTMVLMVDTDHVSTTQCEIKEHWIALKFLELIQHNVRNLCVNSESYYV